jgi:2'-5' RNA ligase
MRLFAALIPPLEAAEDLDEFLAPRRAAAEFRWAPIEQFHLTLAFMAHVDDWRIDELGERLAEALGKLPVAAVRIAGPVAFPNPARAKVLGAGVVAESEGADEILRRMSGRARSAAVKSGIEVDGQRFRPHLTIARLGRPGEVSNWVKLLESYVGPPWAADHVELVASHLGEGPRGRPRYETLAEIAIGSGVH